MNDVTVSVSELVALINQTLDYAYPVINVEGEVANFKVSKNRWIYFDLKDEHSTVRFFGSVYNLKTPLEDGMKVKVTGSPKLHNLYGFSVTVRQIELSGEGTIKRAQEMLKAKLEAEGLFAAERKRLVPEYPQRIGLITSSQAAAYQDFIKIINQRWSGLEINHIDVQVQGDAASDQIVRAIKQFSEMAEPVDVVVIIRGGGSPEDLAAFSTEPVVRAVSASRIPTIVGIGHEHDISLAELAADVRASTPTNAAQLVIADKKEVTARIDHLTSFMSSQVASEVAESNHRIESLLHRMSVGLKQPALQIKDMEFQLSESIKNLFNINQNELVRLSSLLSSLDPSSVLKRGYSIARTDEGRVVQSADQLKVGQKIMLELSKGNAKAEVTDVD